MGRRPFSLPPRASRIEEEDRAALLPGPNLTAARLVALKHSEDGPHRPIGLQSTSVNTAAEGVQRKDAKAQIKERGPPSPRVVGVLVGTRGPSCPRSARIFAGRDEVWRLRCGVFREPRATKTNGKIMNGKIMLTEGACVQGLRSGLLRMILPSTILPWFRAGLGARISHDDDPVGFCLRIAVRIAVPGRKAVKRMPFLASWRLGVKPGCPFSTRVRGPPPAPPTAPRLQTSALSSPALSTSPTLPARIPVSFRR